MRLFPFAACSLNSSSCRNFFFRARIFLATSAHPNPQPQPNQMTKLERQTKANYTCTPLTLTEECTHLLLVNRLTEWVGRPSALQPPPETQPNASQTFMVKNRKEWGSIHPEFHNPSYPSPLSPHFLPHPPLPPWPSLSASCSLRCSYSGAPPQQACNPPPTLPLTRCFLCMWESESSPIRPPIQRPWLLVLPQQLHAPTP